MRRCYSQLICILAMMLFAHATVSVAFAQADPPRFLPERENLIEHAPSAGTLIAAALESAGYEALSIVLDDLDGTIKSLATLILICVMAIGLYQLATGGDVKNAAWLLIAPPTFYFLINAQVLAAGATWQFGTYDGSEELEIFIGDTAETSPEVPWLFHRFNVLISSVIQELVKVITNYDSNEQMRFLVRAHILDDISHAQIGSPELTSLIQFTFAKCGDGLDRAVNLKGSVYREGQGGEVKLKNPTSSQATSLVELQKAISTKNITLGNGAWLSSLQSSAKKLQESTEGDAAALQPYDACLNQYVYEGNAGSGRNFTSEDVVSCGALLCMIGVGANFEAKNILERIQEENLPKDGSDALDQQIMYDVRRKFEVDQTVVPPDGQSADATLAASMAELRTILAGLMVRKFRESADQSNFLAHTSDRWQYHTNTAEARNNLSVESQHELAREYKQDQLSERENIQMYVFTQLLPYVQGIILYVLAISYPFCALFVLIPDKATTFFIWFAAWVWAKSWDLGWAVVMVIENLLWEFMSLADVQDYEGTLGIVTGFDEFHRSASRHELATYYVIMSMMLSAVPLITGKVLLGSKAMMAQGIINGLKKVSDNIGEKVSRRKAISQLRDVTSKKAEGMRDFISQGVGAALTGSYDGQNFFDANGNKLNLNPGMAGALSRLYGDTGFQEARSNIKQTMETANALTNSALALGQVTVPAAAVSMTRGNLWHKMAALAVARKGVTPEFEKIREQALAVGRAAFAAESQLMQNVQEFMAYEHSFTNEFRNWEALRAAISDRGEFWNMPDAPTGALAGLDNLAQSSETAMVGMYGDLLGGAASLGASTTHAVSTYSLMNKGK